MAVDTNGRPVGLVKLGEWWFNPEHIVSVRYFEPNPFLLSDLGAKPGTRIDTAAGAFLVEMPLGEVLAALGGEETVPLFESIKTSDLNRLAQYLYETGIIKPIHMSDKIEVVEALHSALHRIGVQEVSG